VIHFRDLHQLSKEETEDVIIIDRTTKWGNPFRMTNKSPEERARVIVKYEEWIRKQPQLLQDLPDLAGKTMVCWCAPLPCHGDVLIKLIKEMEDKADASSDTDI
jgi:hypothetical protein